MNSNFRPPGEFPTASNMNPSTSAKIIAGLAASGSVILALLLLGGCSKKEAETSSTSGDPSNMAGMDHATHDGKQLYQCSMHPNIVSEKSGTCPICAMDLQPVRQVKAEGIPGRAAVQLSPLQEQLINLRVTPVRSAPATKTLRAVGVITYDETRLADVNSKLSGWVETLYVDKPGQFVETNQPLLALYSPDLYSAQQEYLLALQQAQKLEHEHSAVRGGQLQEFMQVNRRGTESLLRSARKRLELWDISAAQIKALEQAGQPEDTLELTAPTRGFVVNKNVFPKQMIQPGMVLYRIADLSTVWLDAAVYESELPFVKVGQSATVTVDAYPGQTFIGEVAFIYPYLEQKTRTAKVRLVLDNSEHLLKPAMYGNAVLTQDLGEQLLVPAGAVFDTGKRQYVFVQKEPGLFVPREIQLGTRTDDHFVVTQGVAAGDKIVIDGNFLLDSESQLKAAASGSTEAASPPEQAHEHPAAAIPLPAESRELFAPLITDYLTIQSALARDSTDDVPAAVARMIEQTESILGSDVAPPGKLNEYRAGLTNLNERLSDLTATELDEVRTQFGHFSEALVSQLARFAPPLQEPLIVASCPMWKQSPGRWLQSGPELKNPFMGLKMLTCGETQMVIGEGRSDD